MAQARHRSERLLQLRLRRVHLGSVRARQEALRGEYSQEAVAQKNKKMIDDMNNMMMMGGMAMPTMGGSSSSGGGAAAAAASMPGMEGIPPEMQAMMQQMMASGMDPSQMDAASMTAMFAGMQGAGAAGQGGQGGQGQNFGRVWVRRWPGPGLRLRPARHGQCGRGRGRPGRRRFRRPWSGRAEVVRQRRGWHVMLDVSYPMRHTEDVLAAASIATRLS